MYGSCRGEERREGPILRSKFRSHRPPNVVVIVALVGPLVALLGGRGGLGWSDIAAKCVLSFGNHNKSGCRDEIAYLRPLGCPSLAASEEQVGLTEVVLAAQDAIVVVAVMGHWELAEEDVSPEIGEGKEDA